ncbi:MAG TPA: YdeI/OmpD-associated family protein [Verrucomicrobiales bacterium]|nr:YdeI/OmpD-associated family protein [Verrucomicrobiales bacterium]
MPIAEQPIVPFASAAAFRRWLKANHAKHQGIWMQLAKKDSGIASITYAEALDEALCYGWIDGQKKSHDAQYWLQKFTRRGPRSVWSKINIGHIERLTGEGRMQSAGQAAVEAAKADGRWEQAYHSSRTHEVPEDFLEAVRAHAEAKAFFDTLNQANRYAIYFRLTTAQKPETRARRFEQLLEMLKRGEKLH